ncbi:MAG TPA: homocysteine S-methyltransferase family protein [Halanaerobiales bacterium]|nr:homocysteine S-methyltransferase family protein [Halanaerobiales bacterium]
MKNILQRLKNEILVFDGAIGTELQKNGLKAGEPPELWNLKNKKKVKKVHESYFLAGSDIIQTNTFGANRLKLKEYNLADKIEEINKNAVKFIKEASSNEIIISGSVGPTGELLKPIGNFTFDRVKNIFAEQINFLKEAGVDLITIETISDIQEARAAVIAAKEVSNLPVLCSLTYEENGKTISGTGADSAAIILEAVGADILGINCSIGPKDMISVLEKLKNSTHLPLSFKPNAGMPQLDSLGNTVYNADADYMADYINEAVKNGANIIGGCCGTGPDYIKKVKEKVKNKKPLKRKEEKNGSIASRTKIVRVGENIPTTIIGEKINPSGNEQLTKEIKNGKTSLLGELASKQEKSGADIVDLNIGVADFDQKKYIKKAIFAIHNKCDIPVSIDTSDYEAMEEALKSYAGKALINSVTAEKESINKVLPLAKKYGASVIALTLTDSGIPESAEKRVEVAKKILEKAKKLGIPKKNIFVDTLVLTAGSSQEQIDETLRAVKLIKEKLGLKTVLGISNISYGLPARRYINRSFLAMAIREGLNMAIVNPLDEGIINTIKASDLLVERDKNAQLYIKKYHKKDNEKIKKDNKSDHKDIGFLLKESIIDGDDSYLDDYLDKLLKENEALEIINEILIPAIKIVGDKYDKGEFYLPQLMSSAKTMEKAVAILKPLILDEKQETKGKLLMATVKGDIHDIGKNIVKIMLQNNGFEVFDLGKNVADNEIINSIKENNIDIVALSSLMTTTLPSLKRITKKIKDEFPKVKVIVGGAVVTKEYASKIGADGYADNAFKAVEIAEKIINN